jgi:hypothetical protein
VAVLIAFAVSARTITSVVDTQGNTYTQAHREPGSAVNAGIEIWYSSVTQPGPLTVTVTADATTGLHVAILELRNVDKTNPVRETNGSEVAGSATHSPGALVIGPSLVLTATRLLSAFTVSAEATGYTQVFNGSRSHFARNFADAGSIDPAWTSGTTEDSVSAAAAFLPESLPAIVHWHFKRSGKLLRARYTWSLDAASAQSLRVNVPVPWGYLYGYVISSRLAADSATLNVRLLDAYGRDVLEGVLAAVTAGAAVAGSLAAAVSTRGDVPGFHLGGGRTCLLVIEQSGLGTGVEGTLDLLITDQGTAWSR